MLDEDKKRDELIIELKELREEKSSSTRLENERKRAEDALCDNEKFLNDIFDGIQDGISVLDRDWTIVRVNKTMERWYQDMLPLVGKKCFYAYHGRSDPCENCPNIKALKEKTTYSGIIPREVSGRIVGWQEVHSFPLLDDDGNVRGFIDNIRDITKRKQAEEALRKSEKRFKQLIKSSPVPMALYDKNEDIEYLNEKFVKAFGYTIEDLPNVKYWWLLAYPDKEYRAKICDSWHSNVKEAIIEGREIKPVENEVTCKDGSIRFMEAVGSPIGDKILVAFSDITERKRAEEEARLANLYNRSLIEASLDPLVTIAPDGKITDVNLATERATGYPREQLIGTDFSNYFTDPEKAKEGYRTVFEQGLVTDYPLEIRHCNGQVTPVIYNASVYRDASGRVIGVFAAARDITERKRAEMALKENESFLNNIFSSIQDGISVLDPNLNIIRVNPIMERWYGSGIVGEKCYKVYHGRHKPCERCPSIRAIHEKTMQKEIVYDRRGWTELYAFPMINYKGEVTGIIEHVRDITERKRAEEALEEAKNQAEIYLDLMGHDINNLNQVGMGYLEIALDTLNLDQKGRALLAKPLEALKNSSKLIDNVRKIQQVKTGEPKLYEIDVARLLRELIPNYMNIDGREVTINYVSSCHCFVMANDLLTDVFSNILGNAVKHSSGHLTINVRVSKVESVDQAYCKVTIEDNGPGIPDNVKKKLFSRFQRGHTKASGKGLGLYLVRSLMQYYHGYVWIEDSVPDNYARGTRFVVMLPLIEDALLYDNFNKNKSA